jgi:hypothetical protein
MLQLLLGDGPDQSLHLLVFIVLKTELNFGHVCFKRSIRPGTYRHAKLRDQRRPKLASPLLKYLQYPKTARNVCYNEPGNAPDRYSLPLGQQKAAPRHLAAALVSALSGITCQAEGTALLLIAGNVALAILAWLIVEHVFR